MILALDTLGLIQTLENDLYRSTETYQRALQLEGEQPHPNAAETTLGLARIHYEWNDLETAERYGQRSLELVRQYADQLRLVVLDVNMDLLDGTLAAVQIRRAVPHVPIMPFTSYVESLPALLQMGCVLPALKRADVMREMPAAREAR